MNSLEKERFKYKEEECISLYYWTRMRKSLKIHGWINIICIFENISQNTTGYVSRIFDKQLFII